MEHHDLSTLAHNLPFEQRKQILSSFPELELHRHLRSLLVAMEPNNVVEITHGGEELGKDLVMVGEDKFGQQVVALVVKVGNVGGKTMGKVDEIKSQVDQCFLHPTLLKPIRGALRIREVWIMVAGEFTANAQKRLDAETRGTNIRHFDLKWLVERFTQYYPQVFFEGKMVDFLNEQILKLEKRRILSSCPAALSDSWVEPLVDNLDSPITLDENALVSVIKKRRLPFSDLRSVVLPENKRIVLAGEPGTGKTTALAKLALDMLKEALSLVIQRPLKEGQKVPTPLLLLAREIVQFDDCQDLLNHYMPEETKGRFIVTLLLVDGLDEVSPSLRGAVIDKVTKFSEELDCSAIVASRKIEMIENPVTPYKKFELLPFDLGRALALLKKLVTDGELLQALQEGLARIASHISMTPLSLSLLVKIAESYKEIPASVTELYDRFTDIALGRFDKEKGIEVLFDYEIKKRFLADLAFTGFLLNDTLEVPRPVFDGFVASYAETHTVEKTALQTLVHEIERSGLLNIHESVTFCHRSFLDYFAAYSVYVRQDQIEDLNQQIAHLYYSGVWGEVAFFYIGMKKEISNATVQAIITSDMKGLAADIDRLLMGRLLQAGWHSPSETKIAAIRQSLPFASKVRDTLIRATQAQHVDMPRIVADFFVLALCDQALVSTFIEKEEGQLFDALSADPDNLYSSLLLLWASRRFRSPDQLRTHINCLLAAMSKAKDLTPEEEARALMICRQIETGDPSVTKAIKRKLEKLKRRSPSTFRELLPRPPKGFRRRPSNPNAARS